MYNYYYSKTGESYIKSPINKSGAFKMAVKKNKEQEWTCRVCNHPKYESRELHTIAHGVGVKKSYFCCAGCGVLFAEPEKFSKVKN